MSEAGGKSPSRIIGVLNAFGVLAILAALGCLAGTFYVTNDIMMAFLLGAFSAGLLGAILLFGFAKMNESLVDMQSRVQELREHVDELREQGKPG